MTCDKRNETKSEANKKNHCRRLEAYIYTLFKYIDRC